MKYAFWAAVLAPSVLAGLVIATACSSTSDRPPVLNNLSEGGHLGGGVGGGGGGSSGNACSEQGGQCLRAGDIAACPQPDTTESLCGSPLNDAETSGLFCCFGLNDAGANDVITD